jgi:hypothetical protein
MNQNTQFQRILLLALAFALFVAKASAQVTDPCAGIRLQIQQLNVAANELTDQFSKSQISKESP